MNEYCESGKDPVSEKVVELEEYDPPDNTTVSPLQLSTTSQLVSEGYQSVVISTVMLLLVPVHDPHAVIKYKCNI